MKNRKREICTSGTVRDEDGNILIYSANDRGDRGNVGIIRSPNRASSVSRGSVYYLPRPVPEADLAIMRRLDRLHLEYPFAGARMLKGLWAAEGSKIGRRHVKTLMRRMGIEALYRLFTGSTT